MTTKTITQNEILAFALVGMQIKADYYQAQIDSLKQQLQPTAKKVLVFQDVSAPPVKRNLSAAARRRIGAAQKKRWAKFHRSRRELKKSKV